MTRLDPQPWMTAPQTRKLMEALGGQARFVGGAVRNALLAIAMARHGTPGGETVLEGEAGFYHAYAGNNRGELRYSFTGFGDNSWLFEHSNLHSVSKCIYRL